MGQYSDVLAETKKAIASGGEARIKQAFVEAMDRKHWLAVNEACQMAGPGNHVEADKGSVIKQAIDKAKWNDVFNARFEFK